jgi:uncharacterized protein
MTQLAGPETTADGTPVDAETAACAAALGAYTQTPRTTPTRYPDRASYDRTAVHAVLDEALVCHVGFVLDGAPVVLPTIHVRVGETLYVHGSSGGRWAKLDGEQIGVTVTLLDGIALGRSWMHHSAPFRCVVIHGTARVVRDAEERLESMRALMEHVAPGRSQDSREPNKKELAATTMVAIDLTEVTLKARGSYVADDESDLDGPHWAGVIPLKLVAGQAIPADDLKPGVEMPAYARHYTR